jgi:hypothetical protein
MILRLLDQQITNDAAQHGRRRCSTGDLENRSLLSQRAIGYSVAYAVTGPPVCTTLLATIVPPVTVSVPW